MNKNEQHINDLLRQRFENFEPTPPEHIWVGIEKGLDAKKAFVLAKYKYYIAAILLLALIPMAYIGFNTFSNNTIDNNDNIILEQQFHAEVDQQNDIDKTNEEIVEIKSEKIESQISSSQNSDIINNSNENISKSENVNIEKEELNSIYAIENTNDKSNEKEELDLFGIAEGFTIKDENIKIEGFETISIGSLYTLDYGEPYSKTQKEFNIVPKSPKKKTSHWENNVLVGFEFSLTNLDSVSITNSYSLAIEPTKYFNKNWFVRFGLNLSYTGDAGFTDVDYVSNDFMGTYDDVYNVTFDTIGGTITPIYHTKTVEVWDSIQHIAISEVNNRYLFTNLPVLLGYKSNFKNINWYLYAGPAIGIQLAKWIDDHSMNTENIEILNLNNKLPIRSTINYQMWVGAGIEYKVGGKASLILEPSYKYYFNSLYSDEAYKVNTSAFALRIGFNYKIGK